MSHFGTSLATPRKLYACVNSTLNITCCEPRVIVVWSPDPFLLTRFCTCAVKRGREERKGSGEYAYPATDPGRNVVVGDKNALVTTVCRSCQATADGIATELKRLIV